MWICRNCGTENEDNFKFCWSCGQNKPKAEPVPEPPQKIKPKPVEKIPEPPKPVEKIPDVKEKPPIAGNEGVSPVIKDSKPKPHVQKVDDDEDILPMFSRVAGVEKTEPLRDDDTSLEKKVFTIALRLAGLFFLYRFFAALPDLIGLVSSALRENSEDISEMFTSGFIFPVAKILAYFIVGIYLIASGRILIRLLPDR
jgi:hypothetical protein